MLARSMVVFYFPRVRDSWDHRTAFKTADRGGARGVHDIYSRERLGLVTYLYCLDPLVMLDGFLIVWGTA